MKVSALMFLGAVGVAFSATSQGEFIISLTIIIIICLRYFIKDQLRHFIAKR